MCMCAASLLKTEHALKKILISPFIFLLAVPSARGQITYGGVQQGQLAVGRYETCYGFSMVHGARVKRYLLGIGLDVLFKRPKQFSTMQPYNTSAVFASGRMYTGTRRTLFMKGDGGLNFISQQIPSPLPVAIEARSKVGGYAAFGMGIRARIGKEVFYTFDISYVYRQTRYVFKYSDYADQKYSDLTDIRRTMIVLAMGIEVF
jgi:hypothetical protein